MDDMHSLNHSSLPHSFVHLVRARLGNTLFGYVSRRTYIVHVHLRIFDVQSYPNSYPMALTTQDKCAPK